MNEQDAVWGVARKGHRMRSAARLTQGVRLALAVLAGTTGVLAHAEMAQHSLIIADPPAVEPNVMFTLDDSGSMLFNYLPDTEINFQLYAIHPGEPAQVGTYEVKGALPSEYYALAARRRSPDVNLLYYDPRVLYLPWMKADGTREPKASPEAAYYFYGHSTVTVNLRGTYQLRPNDHKVCVGAARGWNDPCEQDYDVTAVKPATYFLFKGRERLTREGITPRERERLLNDVRNYTRVSISEATSFQIDSDDRTDCMKAANGVRICTQEQEYQNFANWYQYHRFRHLLAVGAVSEAFARQVGSDVRVGYGRINKGSTSVDGRDTGVVERGVRRFQGADKDSFFNWLQRDVHPSGGTPLLGASISVGDYFSRDDMDGPWADQGPDGRKRMLSCRRSYHILMTDGQYNDLKTRKFENHAGIENADGDKGPIIPASGRNAQYQYLPSDARNKLYPSPARKTLADIAMYYWNRDLLPRLPNNVPVDGDSPSFWQNVTMYTLGFGVDGSLPAGTPEIQTRTLERLASNELKWPETINDDSPEVIDDLWHAAVNGHGRYVNVKNSTSFLASMRKILAEIVNRNGSTAGVAVNSRALQANNQKFVPSFMTRSQTGNLMAYALDSKGEQGAPQWSAIDKLPHWSWRRAIVGNGNTSGERASKLYWSSDRPNDLPTSIKAMLLDTLGIARNQHAGNEAVARGRQLVAYLLGDGNYETTLFRARRGVLGQIINSTPVFIGATTNQGYASLPAELGGKHSGSSTYRAYLKGTKGRQNDKDKLVVVGANDGFVHAFRASDGVERFAYAPYVVLQEMARLADKRQTGQRLLMDGPLVEADAHLGGRWQNVVVGSTGAGPKAVFALNMTGTADADLAPKALMWELDASRDRELGHVLAAPEVGVLRDGTWVAVFGNGYESESGRAQLFVVDLATGEVLKRLDTGVGSKTDRNGLGGVKLQRDGNQVITAALAGDLKGNMWKFDLASGDRSKWKVAFDRRPLFRTQDARPFTAAPVLVPHPRGGTMVLAGTGKLFEPGDERSRAQESLYGLWDQSTMVQDMEGEGANRRQVGWKWREGDPVEARFLVTRRQTVSADGRLAYESDPGKALNWALHRGWQIPLDMMRNKGLRLIAAPQMVSGMALFETMTPVVEVDYARNPCAEQVNVPGFSTFVEPITGGMATKQVIDTNHDGAIDNRDRIVSSWSVENWTGRSVVLNEEPPKPCSTAPCTQQTQQNLCPEGSLTSVAMTVESRQVLCVDVPTPTRWWWRELSVPDITYNAGATPTAPVGGATQGTLAGDGAPGATKGTAPRF